jgi:HAD superfamily hydrolase (TIGR01509 family)
MMQAPEIAVFDLGKVLLDFDYTIAARRLFGRSATSAEDLSRLINQSPLLLRYESGGMTTEEFFDAVSAAAGFRGPLDEFAAVFSDIFAAMPPMIELHQRLRARGVPTFIFSNTNELAVRHIRAKFPFFSQFDGYVLSFEHGAIKPQARLYEVVEEHTRRRGSQILYVDDRPENVAAGAARGWHAVLHSSPEATTLAVQRLGLLG